MCIVPKPHIQSNRENVVNNIVFILLKLQQQPLNPQKYAEEITFVTGVVSTVALVSWMAAWSVPSVLNHKSVLAATVTASVLGAACIGG